MPNYTQSFPSEQQKLEEWQYFATDENWEEILSNDTLFGIKSLGPFSPLYPDGDKKGRLKDPMFSPWFLSLLWSRLCIAFLNFGPEVIWAGW